MYVKNLLGRNDANSVLKKVIQYFNCLLQKILETSSNENRGQSFIRMVLFFLLVLLGSYNRMPRNKNFV